MALNYPGPYEVRIFYTCSSIQHSQRLNVRLEANPAPGADFSTINALRRDNMPFALNAEVDSWVTLIRQVLPTTGSTIDFAELWKYTPGTFDSEFVSTYPIGLAGASATGIAVAGQMIWTFRTQEGGTMKISVMEGVATPGPRKAYTALSAQEKNIADAVFLGTAPWLARDTSYPFAFAGFFPGQNEALFKKRYRP